MLGDPNSESSEGVDVFIHATPHFWQDITSGRGTQLPIYDFQRKARTGYTQFEASESKVVIVEGTYALRTEIRPFLDIGVGVVSRDCGLFLKSSAPCLQMPTYSQGLCQQLTENK
jgi:hypothetical protein